MLAILAQDFAPFGPPPKLHKEKKKTVTRVCVNGLRFSTLQLRGPQRTATSTARLGKPFCPVSYLHNFFKQLLFIIYCAFDIADLNMKKTCVIAQ